MNPPPDKQAPRPVSSWIVLLPLVLFLVSGWRGLDFGAHWDQGHRVLNLTTALEEQTLLPEEYNYPSVTFWLTVAGVLPEAAQYADTDDKTVWLRPALREYIQSNEFQVRCRSLFLLLASLTILWTFAAHLSWRKKPWEALLAACLVAGSFEVAYHSRWVAPDAILMQFGALCLLACIRGHIAGGRSGWLTGAAIAAGLAMGSKYTGGIFLLPVLLVTWQQSRSVLWLLRACLIFAGVFLITTPGVLLEPTKFAEDLLFELQHYADGHVGYSVVAGLEHFGRNMRYLLLAGPSQAPLVSILLSVLGLFGVVALWRESRALAAVLLLVPLLYVPYISLQKVMFVRNLLLLFPVAALLSARGFGHLWDLRPAGALRLALASCVSLGVVYNLGFGWHAGTTIRESSMGPSFARLDKYIAANSDQVIQLSPRVLVGMQAAGIAVRKNARVAAAEDAQLLACFAKEIRHTGYWPSNDPSLVEVVFGPLSANYDYYATWWQPHVIVIDRQAAHEMAALHPPPAIRGIFPDLQPAIVPPAVLKRQEEERKRREAREAKQ